MEERVDKEIILLILKHLPQAQVQEQVNKKVSRKKTSLTSNDDQRILWKMSLYPMKGKTTEII